MKLYIGISPNAQGCEIALSTEEDVTDEVWDATIASLLEGLDDHTYYVGFNSTKDRADVDDEGLYAYIAVNDHYDTTVVQTIVARVIAESRKGE